jgi:hypothetical protein
MDGRDVGFSKRNNILGDMENINVGSLKELLF